MKEINAALAIIQMRKKVDMNKNATGAAPDINASVGTGLIMPTYSTQSILSTMTPISTNDENVTAGSPVGYASNAYMFNTNAPINMMHNPYGPYGVMNNMQTGSMIRVNSLSSTGTGYNDGGRTVYGCDMIPGSQPNYPH